MLLPAAYAAGESLSSVANNITAELFTQKQPSYALANNIYFDKALLPIPENYTVNFKSSDSSVIEIVNVPESDSYGAYQYGKVKRAKYADKSATVTMTLSDGTNTVTKDYKFTVVSEATKIYYSDTFRYEGYAGNLIQTVKGLHAGRPVIYDPALTHDGGWQSLYDTSLNDNYADGRRFRTILYDDENNYCLRAERPFAVEEYNYTRCLFKEKPKEKTELSMRLMADETKVPQIYIFHLWGTFINENGSLVRKQVMELQLHRRSDGGYFSATNASGEKSVSYTSVNPQNGEWFKLSVCFDVQNQTYDLYYNDEKLNTATHNFTTKYDETLQIVNMNDFQYNAYRKNAGGVLYLDDMVIRTDSHYLNENQYVLELRDELVLSEIMNEADGEFNADAIDSDITIDYSKTNAQNLINSHNLTVEWSSDIEGIFSFNGNNIDVKQPTLDTNATLTAKITDNNTGNSIDKSYLVKVLCDDSARQINDAYNALTPEILTSQVLSAVTKNIEFPTFEGVTVEWVSNSQYLTSDGTVVRSDEDVNVTLTAIISDSGTSFTASKSFSITILAKGKAVYSSDNLYHPENNGMELSKSSVQQWSNININEAERLTNTIIVDEDNNYVMQTERPIANTKDYNFTQYKFSKPLGKEGEVSFRFKLLHTQIPQLYIFQLYGQTQDENDKVELRQAVEVKIEYTNGGGYIYSAGPDVYIRNGELDTDRWYTMKIAFDNAAKTYDVYLDGKKLNTAPLAYYNTGAANYEQIDFLNMSTFRYNSFRDKAGAKLYVDDVVAVGTEGIELATVFYDAGTYRTTDATGIITGVADGKVYIYNPTGSVLNGTLILAGYDNNKLLWAKTQKVALTSDYKAIVIDFADLEIPFSDQVEVKAFFFKNKSAYPYADEAVSANSLTDMKPITMYDTETGNEYKVLNMMGEDIMRCYYTMQCTSLDGTKMYFHDHDFNLYEYDILEEKGRFLDRLLNDYTIVTSPLGNVFYVNADKEIIKMNCETYEKTVVTTLPEEYCAGYASMIQVNNDESRISIEWTDLQIQPEEDGEKHISRFPVYDLEKEEWILDVTYGFDTPWYAPNHKSINPNPELKNLVLFAHEGNMVKDRVWVMNLDTKEPYNVFVQKQYSDTETGETAGHEGWTYDGQHVFFVNTSSRIGGYSGFSWVGYDGKNRRYINSDNGYCHVGIHPYTDRWAIGDTDYNGVDSTITLIDCYTGESFPIATIHQTGVNPGHCHPNFSFDGKTAIFGMYDERDVISIGWADVSKYIDNAPQVYKYNLSDNCTIETAERNDKGEPNKSTRYDVESYYLPPQGTMRVQYRGAEIESADADITVTYMGRGNENIVLEYMVWTNRADGTNYLERRSVELPMANSGKWITHTISLSNINLENMERLEGDFIIKGGTSGCYISNVSVKIN